MSGGSFFNGVKTMKKFNLDADMWSHPELNNVHWTNGINNLITKHNEIILAISWINESIGKIKQHQLLTSDKDKEVNFECLKDFSVWYIKHNHPTTYFIYCQENGKKPELFKNQLMKDKNFSNFTFYCSQTFFHLNPHRIMLPEEY